jgi:hypothetical protein
MIRIIAAALFLVVATSAQAQQQPDPAFLQRALAAMQGQRNQAMDVAVAQQARADGLVDDLAKANARIRELEPKPDDLKKSQ